jgi:uncharacterized Zn-finger protein
MKNNNRPMTPAAEMIVVDDAADQVRCDGGGGPLGHPVVYYGFDDGDKVECLYCDRIFIKKRAMARVAEGR